MVCALVAALGGCRGAPIANPRPFETEPLQRSGELSVLTYNVHGLPPLVTGSSTRKRYKKIAPLLSKFDVVGLQEDFIDSNHQILAKRRTHRTRVRFAKILRNRWFGSGLTVFAKKKDAERHNEYYTNCHGVFDAESDCLASKGFQVVRLELSPGVEVDLYNTHFDAGEDDADDEARAAQIEQIVYSMTTYSEERAVIFTGDTNLAYSDEDEGPMLEEFLDEAGLSDACLDVGCDEDDHIDRILLRSSASVSLDAIDWQNEPEFFDEDGNPMSDHPAISVRLLWNREGR